jgi:hypothetical protein
MYGTSPVSKTLPFDNSANGFSAKNAQAAIEESRATAEGKVRFAVQLVQNGSLTNAQRVGYDALLPNSPVIVPRNCILREITFSNSATNADARFDIYVRAVPAATNATTGATLLQQWTLTNALSAVLSGMAHTFTAGQELLIVFIDTGDNPSDAVLTCFFQVS